MTFNIIGTGNMAWFLAKGLTAAGHQCLYVYGRDEAKAQTLATAVNATACTSLNQITDDADCCLIAVSDTAIPQVAQLLSLKNCLLLHTAGAADINILANSAENYGVLWPVYSIQKDFTSANTQIPFAIEGNNSEANQRLKELATALGDYAFEAGLQQRSILHLCAVLSNNFTNHLLAITEQLCVNNHLPFDTLKPIIKETSDNIITSSPHDKQTGPAKRGDIATMEKHLALLKNHPEWQQVYEAISASIGKMYHP